MSIGKRIVNTQLILGGKIPVYSANVFELFGHINELLITDFSVPSVLWGIDGDWQVNICQKICRSIQPTTVALLLTQFFPYFYLVLTKE
jgi:hypothetical protein